jgi:hypothetical protein
MDASRQFVPICQLAIVLGLASNFNLKDLFEGMDDSLGAGLIPLESILDGTVSMAFGHPFFVLRALEFLGKTDLITRGECILELSKFRNIRIILECNRLIDELNQKGWTDKNGVLTTLFTCELDEEMIRIYHSKEELGIWARSLGINPSGYLDGNIDDDVTSCMHNDFCLHQKLDGVQSASDCVPIIEGTDGKLYLLSIRRAFGPGKANAAYPGGFNDLKKASQDKMDQQVEVEESHSEAAIRELGEEIKGIEIFESENFTRTTWDLPVVRSKWWDPRAKFYPHGMSNGGVLMYIKVRA